MMVVGKNAIEMRSNFTQARNGDEVDLTPYDAQPANLDQQVHHQICSQVWYALSYSPPSRIDEHQPSLHPQIEHLGTVSAIELDAGGCTLTIADSAPILDDCHVGDSIAVNGACLTATEFDKTERGGWFKVWLANETLERTDLGEVISGDVVFLPCEC